MIVVVEPFDGTTASDLAPITVPHVWTWEVRLDDVVHLETGFFDGEDHAAIPVTCGCGRKGTFLIPMSRLEETGLKRITMN